MPPVTISSWSPARIIASAISTALIDEAHTLLTVSAPTSFGMPARIAACRAGAWPTPAWSTSPMITYSTSVASRPARPRAASIAIAPNSGAMFLASPPPSFPKGVLAVATMTDRLIPVSVITPMRATEAPCVSCRPVTTDRDAERLRRLQRVTDAALTHLDLDALLGELLARIRDVLEADTAAVLLRDEFRNELVARAAVGLRSEEHTSELQ